MIIGKETLITLKALVENPDKSSARDEVFYIMRFLIGKVNINNESSTGGISIFSNWKNVWKAKIKSQHEHKG